jgi:queuine tRNA-ribosyltransferase
MSGTPPIRFEVLAEDPSTSARVGRLHTPHGVVDTPAYMPVGTHGAVRGLTPDQVAATGTQMILGNTYHLHLRPGEDVVREAGGLHGFAAWNGPILTDSGGFQIFSLDQWNEMDEDGVRFRSDVDGGLMDLTPERAVQIQNDLGADIIMVLDHCPALPAERHEIEDAVDRTTRWAARCKEAHARPDQALFGIVQGGGDLDLRQKSLDGLLELDFPGYAIGGVSVGESKVEIHRVVAAMAPRLPVDRPRYLMGIGVDDDLLAGIAAGVDLFDCVLATRNARNAMFFSREGDLRIRNEKYKRDYGPLDARCRCYTCQHFSRAYLRHLRLKKESLAGTLGSIHNIHYLQDLMAVSKDQIQRGCFDRFWRDFPASFAEAEVPSRLDLYD